MKFPRNAKILRSPFEVAPFAAVLFLLVIFLLLGRAFADAGNSVSIATATAGDLPGIDKPTMAMAVDSGGRFYFANQMVSEAQLNSSLTTAVRKFPRAAHAGHSRRQNRDGRPIDSSGAAGAQCRHHERAPRHAPARRQCLRPAMNGAHADSPAPGLPGPKPPGENRPADRSRAKAGRAGGG